MGRSDSNPACRGPGTSFEFAPARNLRNDGIKKSPPPCGSGLLCVSGWVEGGLVSGHAACATHPFGHDADLLDACALGRVNDSDDVAVLQRAGADDEHALVGALFKDVPQTALERSQADVLLVYGDVAIGRVLEHDLV